MDHKQFWIGFNLVKGIGAARVAALLDFFGSLEAAWNAPADDLLAAGLSVRLAEAVQRTRTSGRLEATCERIAGLGLGVLTWEDEGYPRLLKETDQPPPVLYLRGELSPGDDLAVAVVGTRRITAYGRQVAADLSTALARNGVTVISGLARGVDSIAHQASLEAGGRTLAVMGCGVDLVYPPENRLLAERVQASGAILSDYPPGTPPDAANFPPRNRIISGLARAVVVVEAGESSGALITAEFAQGQSRPVYAVPNSIYAPQSKGANQLLAEGARPLLSPQRLLADLKLSQAVEQRSARTILPGDAVEAQLFSLLSAEPLHVDDLRLQTGLPVERVSAALTIMELKGLARQVGGMRYVAVREAQEAYKLND